MGRQSSRIYYQGKDHKDIYFQGHYHEKMYIGNQLVWEKLYDGIVFVTPTMNAVYFYDLHTKKTEILFKANERYTGVIHRFVNCGNFILVNMNYQKEDSSYIDGWFLSLDGRRYAYQFSENRFDMDNPKVFCAYSTNGLFITQKQNSTGYLAPLNTDFLQLQNKKVVRIEDVAAEKSSKYGDFFQPQSYGSDFTPIASTGGFSSKQQFEILYIDSTGKGEIFFVNPDGWTGFPVHMVIENKTYGFHLSSGENTLNYCVLNAFVSDFSYGSVIKLYNFGKDKNKNLVSVLYSGKYIYVYLSEAKAKKYTYMKIDKELNVLEVKYLPDKIEIDGNSFEIFGCNISPMVGETAAMIKENKILAEETGVILKGNWYADDKAVFGLYIDNYEMEESNGNGIIVLPD